MDALSAILTLKALDGLNARSVATAQNLANANSPGYRAIRVSFEETLAQASAEGPLASARTAPKVVTDPDAGAVRMDLELATASSTAMRYAALVEVLNRQLQIDAVAVLIGCACGFSLGLVGALPPSLRALQMSVVDGLKSV